MNQKEINALCDKIRQLAFEIHVYLRHGHLEKIYENALAHRLFKAGIKAKQQYPLSVWDQDGTLLRIFCRYPVEDF
jgi:GxxExxY protein